ncbi:hypothetical protein BDZ89DRAFT_1132767 [Hymenopellis radicata]|nr:hypothetical protein BDZ89DRAFT_1132767 [Hymenopellis radicata]
MATGPLNVTSAARALVVALGSVFADEAIPRIENAEIRTFTYHNLLTGHRFFMIGRNEVGENNYRHHAGHGPGVEREVIRYAIEHLEELLGVSHMWQATNTTTGLFSWNFKLYDNDTRKRIAFVTGSLMALHLIVLGATAYPITPYLYLLMVYDFSTLTSSIPFLRSSTMHVNGSESFTAWPTFQNRNSPDLQWTGDSPLAGLIVSYLSGTAANPAVLKNSSEEDWNEATENIVASIFFGQPVAYLLKRSTDVEMLRKGFDMPIGDVSLKRLFSSTHALSVLEGLSGERVRDIEDVLQHHIDIEDASRYLRGKGHPSSLIGNIIPE